MSLSGPCRNRSLGKPTPATTALLNSLWGREKIKFEHLRKTKDLAATSTKTQDGNIAFLNQTATQGRRPWHAPRGGSIDLSQLNSILPAGFVLPVAGPAIGMTTLSPVEPALSLSKGTTENIPGHVLG